MNEYGLDADYFAQKLKRILQDVSRYTPAEMARELARMSVTADKSVLGEDEFAQSGWISVKERMPKPEQSGKVIGINGDLVFDLTYEDEIWCNVYGEKFTHWMLIPKAMEAD